MDLQTARRPWHRDRRVTRSVTTTHTTVQGQGTSASRAPSWWQNGPRPTTLSDADRHLVRRFSMGLNADLTKEVLAAGGAHVWLVHQLDPSAVADPRGTAVNTWFPSLHQTPEQIYDRNSSGAEESWRVMADLARWSVSRRLLSSRQVHEVMVDFWSNLFNVPTVNGDAAPARVDFDSVIRTYALETFEQLLQHAVTHPAVGVNLGNNVSTKQAPNENLGRELLELYTVGVGAGYSEDEVKASARILTGYRVDLWPSYKAWYCTDWHATGPVSVLGFSSANGSADGRAVTAAYLSHLARHPATARRIARRLCVRFVRDDPSDALVGAVAAAYTSSGTAIRPTLLAMVAHPEFASSTRMKVRTPQEDWQATARALGVVPSAPTSDDSFAKSMHWFYNQLGASPFECPTPNGYPEVNAAWSSAGRMLSTFDVHRRFAAHWDIKNQVTAPDLTTMMPALPATVQTVVDQMGTALLGELPGARISQAVSSALGLPLDHLLTASEVGRYWTPITIAATLLDSPLHVYR